ncbi:MAG TPA: hypothetical protein VIJ18_13310 [Microbacteriaceae bacterium]
MTFDYQTDSDILDDARKRQLADQIGRRIPGLSAEQRERAADRWVLMMGRHAWIEDASPALFADFKDGLGLDGDDSAYTTSW